MKDREMTPRAEMLLSSMRYMGYSFEAAIADIVDNSVSAECRNVTLFFPNSMQDPLAVGILDDGHGLSSDELLEAMRLGSSVDEVRGEHDLGRFGLGMKSASLSQCRILTVVSRTSGSVSAFRWDFNRVIEEKRWLVLELQPEEIASLPYYDRFPETDENGTLVIWEDFDVIEKSATGQIFSALTNLRNKTHDYLSLIFHRYISNKRLQIKINNQIVQPMDPFLENNRKTTTGKEVCISNRDSHGIERLIRIKTFILPFISDMSSEDMKASGGVENYRSLQGFYVYRNERLIIWGTWFGMRLGELTKNARVRVDIPNSLDDIWGIDITKRTAAIPKNVLNQLKKTVRDAMDISTKKMTHRGRSENPDDGIEYVWRKMHGRNNTFYYEINKNGPVYQYVKDKIPSDYHSYIDMLVKDIEQNVPIWTIYNDIAGGGIISEEDNKPNLDDLLQNGITIIDSMRKTGQKTEDAIEVVMKAEPFCKEKTMKEKIIKYYKDYDD